MKFKHLSSLPPSPPVSYLLLFSLITLVCPICIIIVPPRVLKPASPSLLMIDNVGGGPDADGQLGKGGEGIKKSGNPTTAQ